MLAVFTSLILLVLGVAILRFGLWPKRRGSTPHCPKCDYNLTGLERLRCPECGTSTESESIVYGERPRRRHLVAAGIVGCALAGTLLYYHLRQVNWYDYYPTSWLITDLQSTQRGRGPKAWKELMRRDGANSLSQKSRVALTEVCLQEQAKSLRTAHQQYMIDYLAGRYLAGGLTGPQTTRFFSQILPALKLEVRARVVSGDPLPVVVSRSYSRGPGSRPPDWFWYDLDECPLLIDGAPTGQTLLRRQINTTDQGIGGPSLMASGLKLSAGKHTVGTTTRVRFFHGPMPRGPMPDLTRSRLCFTQALQGEAVFEILDAGSPDPIRAIRDTSLEPDLRLNIHPADFVYHSKLGHNISGKVRMNNLPVDIAFDVLVRVNGRETWVGWLFGHKSPANNGGSGGGAGWGFGATLPEPPSGSCDVILRSSEEGIRHTFTLYEYWEGELVFKDVPVEIKD